MNWWGIFWQQLARMCKNQGAMTRGLGTAEPSQPLKLAPPPNTTNVALPHMSYHRKFLPVGVSDTHVPVLLSREH